MPEPRILNQAPRPPQLEPVELSRSLLGALRPSRPGLDDAVAELSSQLHGIDSGSIGGDAARTAFWLNLYNALLLHQLALTPARGNMLRHPRMFSATAYRVGESAFSLNAIEHGVLRRNRRPPIHTRRPFSRRDPRLRALPTRLDPRIHFALNCGARSCPPIHIYSAEHLERDLERATNAYLEAETEITGNRVLLPGLMRFYRRDFGTRDERIRFVAARVEGLSDLATEGPIRIRYGRFDWTAVTAQSP